MIVQRGVAASLPQGAVVTIGVFDGLHLGHQSLLNALLAWARGCSGPAGLITFARHPGLVLEQRAPEPLTSLEHRLLLLERAGLDFAWVLDFSSELARLTAGEFAGQYLAGRLRARGLLLGFDSRIGRDRLGADSPELRELGRRLGFEVRGHPRVFGPRGAPVSSSLIRDAICAGRMEEAEALLGRRVSVLGRVVPGDGLGRQLGFPTANLDPGEEALLPKGVYAVWVDLAGSRRGGVTNVGHRPTVASASAPLRVETHLLDFSGDLYGQTLEVSFVKKLRDEKRFENLAALQRQIADDLEAARRALREAEGSASA
jgi:riboflavin kinase/FMN adenylyltransferase